MKRKIEGFSLRQAAEITEVSAYRLDDWAKNGLLVPSLQAGGGTGVRRRYSREDLAIIAMLRQMRMIDVPIRWLQPAISHLREIPDLWENPPALLSMDANGKVTHGDPLPPSEYQEAVQAGRVVIAVPIRWIVDVLKQSMNGQSGGGDDERQTG